MRGMAKLENNSDNKQFFTVEYSLKDEILTTFSHKLHKAICTILFVSQRRGENSEAETKISDFLKSLKVKLSL